MAGNVLIMAGGTGGPVFPPLACARGFQARGYPVPWPGPPPGTATQLGPAARPAPPPIHRRAMAGQGHASRAHLEVDGGGSDSDQTGPVGRALGLDAVAAGAVGQEHLATGLDVRGGHRLGLRTGGRGEQRVQPSRGEEADDEEHDQCRGVATTGGE